MGLKSSYLESKARKATGIVLMLLPSLFASILTLASVDMQSCYVTGSEKEVECAMFDVPLT